MNVSQTVTRPPTAAPRASSWTGRRDDVASRLIVGSRDKCQRVCPCVRFGSPGGNGRLGRLTRPAAEPHVRLLDDTVAPAAPPLDGFAKVRLRAAPNLVCHARIGEAGRMASIGACNRSEHSGIPDEGISVSGRYRTGRAPWKPECAKVQVDQQPFGGIFSERATR